MSRYGLKRRGATKKRPKAKKKLLTRKPAAVRRPRTKSATEALRHALKTATPAKRPRAKRSGKPVTLKKKLAKKPAKRSGTKVPAKRVWAKTPERKNRVRSAGKPATPKKRAAVKRSGKNALPKKRAVSKGALNRTPRKRPASPVTRKPTASQKRAKARSSIQAKLDKLKKENEKLRRKLTSKQRREQKKRVTKAKKIAAEAIKNARPIPSKREGAVIPATGHEWFGGGPAVERYRRRFDEIRRKAIRAQEFSKVNYKQRTIDSKENVGEIRVVKVALRIAGNVAEIVEMAERAVRSMSGRYDVWMVSFCMAGMGERVVGSGVFVSKVNDPDAHAFQIGYDNTGVWPSAKAMLSRFEDDMMDYGGEKHTVVMLEWFKVQNFTPRGA